VNFEEIMREMEELRRRMMGDMFSDFEDLEKGLETGEIKGEWRIEPIDRPGMKGFIARGFFGTPEPLERPRELLPPLKPPMTDPREPFYDIDAGEDELQIYIELPGTEEKEIELKAEPGKLNLEAGKFRTQIDVSTWILDTEKIGTEYRNGVLKVTIPKMKTDEQLI